MAMSSRTVYEDFQPKVDQKEEERANILAIHLPGFAKDQINVTYVDSTRTIKVQGERPLGRNKRSRFNQSFPVPQDCIVEKIQGTFRNRILTITMPKKTITQAVPVKDENTTKEASPPKPTISQQKPMEDQKETTTPTKPASTSTSTSTSGVEKQREDQKIKPPQTPQKVATETKEPIATGPQTSPSKAQTNGKKKVDQASQPSKQQEDTPKKAAPTPTATTTKQTEEKAEIVRGKVESKPGLKDVVKEKESDKTKDSPMTQISIPKILEIGKKDDKAAAGALDKKPKDGSVGGGSFLEKAKEMKGMDTIMKTVKKLATDDYEDRQLLLNIGVSVLVIVVLGAYITYSYRSSGKSKN